MFKGFKDFIMRGNVIELATGVIIGAAFTAIVTALTTNLIQPIINTFGGGGDVEGLAWQLKGGDESTVIDLGAIITAVINFLIIAAVVYFIIVMPINKLSEAAARRKGQDAEEVAETSETDLLMEIRDLLAAQGGVSGAHSTAGPTSFTERADGSWDPEGPRGTGDATTAEESGRHSAN